MYIRSKILILAYKLWPFPLKGDAHFESIVYKYDISCVINFYGRANLLANILSSLTEQDLPKDKFEVILVEDRGGTKEGREIYEKFKTLINIEYFALNENYGRMGYSRNIGLSKTKGKFILFLDDDTIITQREFLSTLISEFDSSKADAIVPHGNASYCMVKDKYHYHDPYFPTNRCVAYRREVLQELGGFVSEIIGQEDVELAIRFIASGKKFHNSRRIFYMHPPLVFEKLNKAAAVGMSFVKLKNRYPFFIWLILLINGLRYLPLLLFPINTKLKNQGKFSLGFLVGVLYSIIGKEVEYN
ncbi:MAG: glycosyl transferase [Deltaproteobacteria bacterium]|jgi:glycosyltransferase involved in cell wall biosynthesis|nr:MAG: glycosyl transferase [Deltaproteobacteria bacterium]